MRPTDTPTGLRLARTDGTADQACSAGSSQSAMQDTQQAAEDKAARERDLIDRGRHDPEAFGELYRIHHAAIMRYLCRRTGDQHLGEDLAGEVFLSAWRGLGRYRHTGAPFRAWLLRIATNAANQWARRRRREQRAARSIHEAS